MFEDRLQDICGKIHGAVAATLVDRDGITVESHAETVISISRRWRPSCSPRPTPSREIIESSIWGS